MVTMLASKLHVLQQYNKRSVKQSYRCTLALRGPVTESPSGSCYGAVARTEAALPRAMAMDTGQPLSQPRCLTPLTAHRFGLRSGGPGPG